jgi:hypothetical protein
MAWTMAVQPCPTKEAKVVNEGTKNDQNSMQKHAILIIPFCYAFGTIISSIIPYSFASSAVIKKSRSVSLAIFSIG